MGNSRPSDAEISAQLARICASPLFAKAPLLTALLQFLIGRLLDGRAQQLKERTIGWDFFKRPEAWDPKQRKSGGKDDSTVRVNIGHLRDKIQEYYETKGQQDGLIITLPKGGYVPQIDYNPAAAIPLNAKAAQHVWNARTLMDQRTLPSLTTALEFLDEALSEQPHHARILALKAWVHCERGMHGGYPPAEIQKARSLLAEIPNEGAPWEAIFARACLAMSADWEWEIALSLFEQAAGMTHGQVRFEAWYTALLANQGRISEAIAIQQQAVEHFAHDSAITRGDLSILLIMGGRYEEAEVLLRTTLELFPQGHYVPYIHLAILHEAQGRPDKALEVVSDLGWARSVLTLGLRALFSGLGGDRKKAQWHYRKLRGLKSAGSLMPGRFLPASQVAIAALGMGDCDLTVEWLNRAASIERDPIAVWLNVLPFLRHLHHHTGFRSLVTETMRLSLLH